MNLASFSMFKGCFDGRNIQNPKVSRKLIKYKIRIDEMLIYQVFIGCIGLNLARRKKGESFTKL